ncbi:MAG: hypothetical protein ACYDGM_12695 [Vulcanimicrobiaceae bacterium]
MKLDAFMRSFDSTRIMLELTSGRPIGGEVTFVGDDFLAVRVHAEHDVSEIVPFMCIATIHLEAVGLSWKTYNESLPVIADHGRHGVPDVTPYSHFALLRTVEDAFGIHTSLREAGAAGVRPMLPLFELQSVIGATR